MFARGTALLAIGSSGRRAAEEGLHSTRLGLLGPRNHARKSVEGCRLHNRYSQWLLFAIFALSFDTPFWMVYGISSAQLRCSFTLAADTWLT